MKDEDWIHIPNFEREEFDDPLHPGSGNLISRELLLNMAAMRLSTGTPIRTHWEIGGCLDLDGLHGHTANSYHLPQNGGAVDFHFVTDKDPRTQVAWVIRSGFRGIGIYYHWGWDGSYLPVGFHVDCRPLILTQLWVEPKKGMRIYLLK